MVSGMTSTKRRNPKEARGARITIRCRYFPEPLISFSAGGLHVDPKSGIARYGPRSYGTSRHPEHVRVGLVGSSETIEKSREWMLQNAEGIPGDAKHPEFPGFQKDRGFFSTLRFDDDWVEQLTQSEIEESLRVRGQRDRFDTIMKLLEDKVRLLAEADQPPE